MIVSITGATGFVGQALLDLAAQREVVVKALTRREMPDRPGVTWIRGDLHDSAALAQLVRGTDAAIHVAGVVNAFDAAGFHLGNVEGTREVSEACIGQGVRRFVFVSSLAAREPELSTYGESKAAAERIVRKSGLDWSIVRPPAIYGPRDTEMFELFKLASRGVVPMPGRGHSSLLHVEDLSRLLLALAGGGEEHVRQVYEPDDATAGGWEHEALARAIGDAVGREVSVPRLPKPVLLTMAGLDRLLRRDKAKLTPDRVGYMTHPDWTCDPGRAPPSHLWTPQIETLEGLKATAKWYREEGWLE